MAEKNKFFLKLPVDYLLGNLKIDRLRHCENGYELVHIYFTLLSEAAPEGGYIYLQEDPMEYVEYISLMRGLNAERVVQMINECQDLGLIELTEEHIYFTDARRLISKECGSAERQRRYKLNHPEKFNKKSAEVKEPISSERHIITHDFDRSRDNVTQKRYLLTTSRYIITPTNDKRYKITQDRYKVTHELPSLLDTNNINNINYFRESIRDRKLSKPLKERAPEKTLTAQKIVDMYNEKCPSLRRCMKLTSQIKDLIGRLMWKYTLSDFAKVFEYAENNEFLKGNRNGEEYKTWKGASLKFLLREDKFKKVLNGDYDDYGGSSGSRWKTGSTIFSNFEQRQINLDDMEALLLSN